MKLQPITNSPAFGFRLTKKQAKLMRKLPPQELDSFGMRLMQAPQENTHSACKKRDRVLREALRLAEKMKGNKQ